jgi:hypothetical protein
VGLSLGVPYVSSSESILTETIKNDNSRTITPSLARSVHCLSLSCVLSCSEGDIVVSRLRLTARSCFRSNTNSYPETVSQGRQVFQEGEGSVCVVDCPSRLPACVLSRTAVVLSFSTVSLSAMKVVSYGSNATSPFLPWRRFRSEQFYAVYARLDLATLLRVPLALPLEYFTNKSTIQPLYML